jgi:hypothetical protein
MLFQSVIIQTLFECNVDNCRTSSPSSSHRDVIIPVYLHGPDGGGQLSGFLDFVSRPEGKQIQVSKRFVIL